MNTNPIIAFIPKRQSGKAYIVRDLLEFTKTNWLPNYFICDVELLTLGRVYNTFKIINHYDDSFSEATIIHNFYDIVFNL
jgi:hypothetical protein